MRLALASGSSPGAASPRKPSRTKYKKNCVVTHALCARGILLSANRGAGAQLLTNRRAGTQEQLCYKQKEKQELNNNFVVSQLQSRS